jgi:hypothetical protein
MISIAPWAKDLPKGELTLTYLSCVIIEILRIMLYYLSMIQIWNVMFD